MSEHVPFGRYLLLDRVDVGGMAEVFAARVSEGDGAGRLVALKRLLPSLAEDPAIVAMFLDEARIAVHLDHPGFARIEDLGRHGAAYFIAMEYVAGKDLGSVLEHLAARRERMPVPLAAFVAARLLDALEHAHGRVGPDGRGLGIVHRDVSPGNVLLSFSGEVKLVDFGLARAGERGAPEQPGVVRGKSGYMSPEQARGLPVDGRADVFAAAVVLHEALTGARLFAASSDLLALERVLEGEVASPRAANPGVPEPLARAVLRALDRDPGRRPAAGALAAEIARHAGAASGADLSRWLVERFPSDADRERARLEG
jgi:serine/threonine-protein kinase